MKRQASILGMVALSSLVCAGCAAELVPPPVMSDAPLGKVIIYRNGVAYFERYGAPEDETLEMRVPSERVDDFLKSLTIVDEKTGEAMPASFPTVEPSGSDVDMTIALPKGHGRLRISYVTESPAWKPSYRVVLGDGGKARLQAWAVVDNVSGEDWRQVKVGVGSTSALSFRYDLHSIRLVERETLSPDSMLALAPPTGGSPYAGVAGKAQVVGNLSADDLAVMEKEVSAHREQDKSKKGGSVVTTESTTGVASLGDVGGEYWRDEAGAYRRPATKAAPAGQPTSGVGRGYGAGGLGLSGTGSGGGGGRGVKTDRPMPATTPKPMPARSAEPPADVRASGNKDQGLRGRDAVWGLANQLRGSNQKVRIEGYAQAGDKEPRQASLDRANAVREQLLAAGVPAANVDAIGTGKLSEADAVRLITVEGEAETGRGQDGKPKVTPIEGQPLGTAHFLSETPMTIERNHSAMVSILNAETEAKKIYFYDPVSPRGSKKFAFNAVRVANPSDYTLEGGPFTVYTGGQFLGEGLSEPLLPHAVAYIPYALDRSVLVEPEVSSREEIDRLLTIQRGIVTSEMQLIRKTKLTLTNRGTEAAEVYVRHQVQPGYELRKSALRVEKLGGAHLFPVTVTAGQALEVVIEEATPMRKTIDIRGREGISAIELYLKKDGIDAALKTKLEDIVKTYGKMADLEERMETLEQQMGVYRTRVDELNVQLVTLKKVAQAQKLSRHLSEKMQEISEKLQQATIEMSDLKGQHMALRIELQDKLAELTLRGDKKDTASGTS